MTNTKLLKEAIKRSGYLQNFLAEKLGISKESLSQKVNNLRPWKQNEIAGLKRLLKLSNGEVNEIFFAEDVYKKYTGR